jgi:hypothetical protein
MDYYDKYLKYKAKYANLKHLEKLYKNKDWAGIIKNNENKYKEAIVALRENEQKLQGLVDNQTIANNNYYSDITNKNNEKILKKAQREVNDLTNKINKLQKLVEKTNNAWKESIITEMKAKVKAAQQDVDAGKAYLSTDNKNITISRELLTKAKESHERAISKLNKDILSGQESENELSRTVQTLNRVYQEQTDTLGSLEARTAPPPVTRRVNNINDEEEDNYQGSN